MGRSVFRMSEEEFWRSTLRKIHILVKTHNEMNKPMEEQQQQGTAQDLFAWASKG